MAKNPNGEEIYYIMVEVNENQKLWGMSWSAFNILVKILGDESTRWVGATVRFERKPVKTARGSFPTLVAQVVSGQSGFPYKQIQKRATEEDYVSEIKEIKDKVQPERPENDLLYECPAKCGFKTGDVKKLGFHISECSEVDKLPSFRARRE